jgi:CheY-like chemotaxis protein
MKIMVVDDEPDVQLLFKQQFRSEIKAGKITFQFAFSGEEALEYLKSQGTTDVVMILSDVNMPGMSGIELLKRLKEKYAQLKVLMITAYGDENNLRLASSYGCDGYVTKPIDFPALKTKIFGG